MIDSIFTKIIKKEIPSDIVFENCFAIGLFDINPKRLGHLLIVPKIQIDNILDMSEDDSLKLFSISMKVAKELKDILEVERVIFSIEGFLVPHVHIHLIPTNEPLSTEINFTKEEIKDFIDTKGKILSEKISTKFKDL